MIVETEVLRAIKLLKNSFVTDNDGVSFSCANDVVKAIEILEGSHR